MRRCVGSRNLKSEEAMARVGPQRHIKQKQTVSGLFRLNLSNLWNNNMFTATFMENSCRVPRYVTLVRGEVKWLIICPVTELDDNLVVGFSAALLTAFCLLPTRSDWFACHTLASIFISHGNEVQRLFKDSELFVFLWPWIMCNSSVLKVGYILWPLDTSHWLAISYLSVSWNFRSGKGGQKFCRKEIPLASCFYTTFADMATSLIVRQLHC